nr:hypothetical protein [Tanacetum cinerariifolium]
MKVEVDVASEAEEEDEDDAYEEVEVDVASEAEEEDEDDADEGPLFLLANGAYTWNDKNLTIRLRLNGDKLSISMEIRLEPIHNGANVDVGLNISVSWIMRRPNDVLNQCSTNYGYLFLRD